MKRPIPSPALLLDWCASGVLLTVTVAPLLLAAGCQPAEAPKPKESTAQVSPSQAGPANPEKPAGQAAGVTASSAAETPTKPKTAMEVMRRMAAAYHQASSYADAGTARLLAQSGDRKVDQTEDFAVAFVRPNKIRLQANQANFVCDGKTIHASIRDLAGQVLDKPAPPRITLNTIYRDPNLAGALSGGPAGPLPQLVLLLAEHPLQELLQEGEEPHLAQSGQVEGHDCYRVELKRPEGTLTFWIDQRSYALRRIVLPIEELRRVLTSQWRLEKPVETVSLVAEFTGATLNGQVDPKAFTFEVPPGSELVRFFIPPNPAQLLSKKVPGFKFVDLQGKPVTAESLAGKVVVLDFWATWCDPCRESLPNLEKVYQQYKNHKQVVFYAVSVDTPDVDNQELAKTFADLKVTIPILRDSDHTAAALRFTGIPTSFIIAANGIVQDSESGANPKLAEVLPAKLKKVLAGENIYDAPLKRYQQAMKQFAETMEKKAPESDAASGPVMEERKVPEAKIAPASKPATLKLTSLWKCAGLKAPGNILVLPMKNAAPRLLVVEGLKSVVEVGLDGKVIAAHPLALDEKAMEVVANLRAFTGADGKRWVVAFASAQQRLHLLDENWKQVWSYPKDALAHPPSGIADVEVADFNGDGRPQICVGYWGVVGVQGVSLEGSRLWSNRSLANVIRMAVGGPDENHHRLLYCADNSETLPGLDGSGQRRHEMVVRGRHVHWIVNGDLKGDGQLLWCGLTAEKLGEDVAIGFSDKGEELWHYALPIGIQPQPIEPLIIGQLAQSRPGQWILPAPDGSIHVLSADGKPLDKFNYGEALCGLATVEINGHPALVVATAKGLEAWKVE